MYYENARPAQIKVPVRAKVVGKYEYVDYKPGRKCSVQRDTMDPNQFVIYFVYNRSQGRAVIHKVSAVELNDVVEFLDERGNM